MSGSPAGGQQAEPPAFPPAPPRPARLTSGAEATTWTATTSAWFKSRLGGPGDPA